MSEEPEIKTTKNLKQEEIKEKAASNIPPNKENNENVDNQKNKKNPKSNTSKKQGTLSPKSNLKQMTLTEIAKNTSPKLKVILNSPNNAAESVAPIQPNQEIGANQTVKKDENNKENEATENENNGKISFSKRNIVRILGSNYNSKNQLIFAVQLKKPAKTLYVPYVDLKKRSPQILCDYFESLISFD